jgi:hypothetical protein
MRQSPFRSFRLAASDGLIAKVTAVQRRAHF